MKQHHDEKVNLSKPVENRERGCDFHNEKNLYNSISKKIKLGIDGGMQMDLTIKYSEE